MFNNTYHFNKISPNKLEESAIRQNFGKLFKNEDFNFIQTNVYEIHTRRMKMFVDKG